MSKHETIVLGTTITCVAAVLITLIVTRYSVDKAAIAKGMIETTVAGSERIVWQYPEGAK